MKPTIVITMGDPAGIGPEVIVKALKSRRVLSAADPVVVGDDGVMARTAASLGVRLVRSRIRSISARRGLNPQRGLNPRRGLNPLKADDVTPGRPNRKTALSMIACIEEAVRMTLTGEADAMVTAPINKAAAAAKAGFRFPGHTEFIAHLTGTKDFAMMLGGPDLKVVLVTTHTPLKLVARQITREAVFKTIEITDSAFKRYFKKPRIAVAGLNPHAGEGGLFGNEELTVIAPAVKKALRLGMDVTGPVAPDTVFYRAAGLKEFDCVVSMYHDQGLGPLKLLHFDDGVNVTLGLPIIRTSVDHGTAYEIAGKGVASAESMITAILMAAKMAKKRK